VRRRKDAEAFERAQRDKLSKGTYIARAARLTVKELAEAFLKECKLRNRRTSTLLNYQSILNGYILPKFGHRGAETIRKEDVKKWLAELLEGGKSAELVNRIIRVFRTVLFHGVTECEVIERNVLQRFRPFPKSGQRLSRDAFTEDEVTALLAAADPHERALIGLLVFTGMRPGEAFALRWEDVDLTAGTALITRTWDWRGKRFTQPKTAAGNRTIALSGYLVQTLEQHRKLSQAGELVFATRNGGPLNPANVRSRMWLPLIQRAGVRKLDMYSLRSTRATLGRVAGESAHNMSRLLGHSRSTLIDQVYARSLPSGMASAVERVTSRVLGEQPKLRVIEGGSRRDIATSLLDVPTAATAEKATG